MSVPSKRLTAIARWGLPAAIGATALALVATAWSIRSGVDSASETLIRGHAGRLAFGIFDEVRQTGNHDARPLFELLARDGLTYIAHFDQDGRLTSQGGRSVGTAADIARAYDTLRPGANIEVRDVVRTVRRRRPKRSDASDPRPSRAGGGYVYEFVPTGAIDLRERSRRVLAVGGFGGVVLLVIAVGLARWLGQREKRREAVEHEQRLAHLGEMSAVLAHEIRNPLASLKGNAELLRKRVSDDEKAFARADRVVAEAVRLEKLTTDLLEFARSGDIAPAEVAPATILERAARFGNVDVDVSRAPARWRVDASRLEQVLVNLLDNANAVSSDGVRARVYAGKNGLIFEIDDSGPGLPAGEEERIFEAFYTTKTHGTGLGLAVAKRLVERHGGMLEASNLPGRGARFRVTLPRR